MADEQRRYSDSGEEDRVLLGAAYSFFFITVVLLVLPFLFGFLDKRLPMSEGWYFLFTALAALIGFQIIRTIRLGRKEVIPRPDRGILEEALRKSEQPISEYMRLSSLIGITGFFRKLEFAGMPLATILMTLILCLLSVGSYVLNKYLEEALIPDAVATGFFELAKLTLGAFIGSFVTKQAAPEGEQLPAGPTQGSGSAGKGS